MAIFVGAYIACTGRPVYRLLHFVPAPRIYIPLLVLGVGAWAWKIYIYLAGIDGWR